VASSAPPPQSTASSDADTGKTVADTDSPNKNDEDDFSSKAQIMTLMTTDVDRVSDFAWHVFSLVGMLRLPVFFLFL
jgi:hypothetical protein